MQKLLVTGAASGIGKCTAELMGHDHELILCDRSEQQLNEFSRYLNHKGIKNETIVCDVSIQSAVENAITSATSNNPIDKVFHAAGVSTSSVENASQLYDINLKGTAYFINAMAPHVSAGTSMLCVASQASYFAEMMITPEIQKVLSTPLDDNFIKRLEAADETKASLEPGAAYGLSKRGVRYLVEAVAFEWGKKDARINTLSPGIIETPMSLAEAEKYPQMITIKDLTPLQRWGQPIEVAKVAEFILSADASFMTGADILLDGGSTPHYIDAVRTQVAAE